MSYVDTLTVKTKDGTTSYDLVQSVYGGLVNTAGGITLTSCTPESNGYNWSVVAHIYPNQHSLGIVNIQAVCVSNFQAYPTTAWTTSIPTFTFNDVELTLSPGIRAEIIDFAATDSVLNAISTYSDRISQVTGTQLVSAFYRATTVQTIGDFNITISSPNVTQ